MGNMDPNLKLHEALTLDALREAAERSQRLKRELDESLQERDELIRLAASWARTGKICKVTGLSRTQIWRIAPGVER